MSKKYRDHMDKISIDEDMKKRIILNINDLIEKESIEDKKSEPKVKQFSNKFIRMAGMYAACFAIVLCGIANKPFMNFLQSKQIDLNSAQCKSDNNSSETSEIIKEKTKDDKLNTETQLNENENDLKVEALDSKGNNVNVISPKNGQDEKQEVNSQISYSDDSAQENLSLPKEADNIQNSNSFEEVNNNKNVNEDEKIVDSEIVNKIDKASEPEIDNNKSSNTDNDKNLEASDFTLNNDSPKIKSNIQSFETLEELKSKANLKVNVPKYLPISFKMDDISLISNKLVSITYINGKDIVEFRTAYGIDDVSNDTAGTYNIEKVITIDSKKITLKGNNEDINIAKWTENNRFYCILAQNGLGEEDILNMAKSID